MQSTAALSPTAPCSFEKHYQVRGKKPKRKSCACQRTTSGHSSSTFITSTTMSLPAPPPRQSTNAVGQSVMPLRDYTCCARSCRILDRRTALSRLCPTASTRYVSAAVVGMFQSLKSSILCTNEHPKVLLDVECSLVSSLKVSRQSS